MYIRKLLGGVATAALWSPVEDAGAAALVAEQMTPTGADAGAAQDHEAGDAADAAASTREADDAAARGEPAEPPKPRVPWQNKRIDKLTAESKTERDARIKAEGEAQTLRSQVAAYEALYGKPGEAAPAAPGGGATSEADVETRIATEADRRAGIRVLNEKIDGVFEAGAKAKGAEWNDRVNQAAAAFGSDLQQRPDFFEALTALDNPADVYFALAGDLDQFAEVLAMTPVKMGMKLAQMAGGKAAPKPPGVSRVPPPINPLDPVHTPDTDLAKVPMEDYAKIRAKQKAERDKARYG